MAGIALLAYLCGDSCFWAMFRLPIMRLLSCVIFDQPRPTNDSGSSAALTIRTQGDRTMAPLQASASGGGVELPEDFNGSPQDSQCGDLIEQSACAALCSSPALAVRLGSPCNYTPAAYTTRYAVCLWAIG